MWWNSMTVFQQVMFIIACSATCVLVVQIILMLIGGATDGGFDGPDASVGDIGGADIDFDVDGDVSDGDTSGGATMPFGLRLLSLRSIIAFVAVGSWVCYTLCYVLDWYVALIIAIACGFAAACLMVAAIIGMEKLQDDGTIDPSNAVGKVGTVYLTVPAARSGMGKINVLIQERYAEYDAVTDSGDPIPTGSEIVVVGNAGNNVLIVKRYTKPSITVETVD